jgi:hypothetical protein
VARRTGDAWSTSRRSVGPLLVRDNGFRAGRRSDVPPLPLRLFIQKTGRTYDLLFEQCGARLLNPYPNVKLALAHYSHMSLVMFPINKTWTFGSLPTEILRTSSNVFSAHQTPRSQTTDCRRSRVVTKAARTQQVAILLSGREVYCFFFSSKVVK